MYKRSRREGIKTAYVSPIEIETGKRIRLAAFVDARSDPAAGLSDGIAQPDRPGHVLAFTGGGRNHRGS